MTKKEGVLLAEYGEKIKIQHVEMKQELSSHISIRPNSQTAFSSIIWKIDWNRFFPKVVHPGGISADTSNFDEFSEFLTHQAPHLLEVSDSKDHFLYREKSDAKLRYYAHAGDCFCFKDGPKIVGVFLGTPIDWGSYYLRYTWILPEYRGAGFYQTFLAYYLECLKMAGVDRAEGDISPSNPAHLHIFSKLQFKITGFNASERWGAMIHLTRFLSQKHEDVFEKQFLTHEV